MTGTPSASCCVVRRYLFIVSALLAVALSLVARSANAQIGSGTLTGKVVDASNNKPLVDVVVTATSPALQGEQIVVTDSSGSFRIPSLPPGDYALRYEGDGYRFYERSGIALGSGSSLRVDAQLLPENLSAEEVTVVAAPPTVDVGSARSGVTIGEEFRNRVPLAPPGGKGGGARSFEQLAEVAPTGRNDLYGASISGTTSVENVYMIDGLAAGDPSYGYNASPLSIDFIKETNVITGGYLPEYGRGGGGVLDVVTQSGSNEFHGSVFGFWSPWQAKPKLPPPQDSIATTFQQDSIRDLGFSLGGPIVKDKLWFFVGGSISRQSFNLRRTLSALRVYGAEGGPNGEAPGSYIRNDDGLILSDKIPGGERNYLAEQTGYQYLGKLTWTLGANDRIELTHRGTPTRSGGDGKYSVDYQTGQPNTWGNPGSNLIGGYGTTAWRQLFDSYNTGLKWSHSALNKRLTFDTMVGWSHLHAADLAADGSKIGGSAGLSGTPAFAYARTTPTRRPLTDFENLGDPSICNNPIEGGDPRCPVSQYAYGGPQPLTDDKSDRVQAREVATFVTPGLGHHIVKAGAEVEFTRIENQRSYPGGVILQESASGRNVSDFRRLGAMTGPDEAYTINLLKYKVSTVSVGAFLQDSWSIMDKVTLNAGFRWDTQSLFADQGRGLVLPNQWSPRVGMIYDPTQRGFSKLFVNYAIYYQSLPLNIMSRAGSGEPQVRASRPRAVCDALTVGTGQCDNPDTLNTGLTNGPSDPNQKWVYLSSGRLAVDPDLKPQSTNELTAGGEYEIIRNGRVSATYIRRWMRNVVEDMSRDEGTSYFLGNPGRGIATDFPEAERTFDAGILAFTKTFSSNYLIQASYTLSQLKGNWEGLFRAQTGQLDPGTNSDFDLVDLTKNRKGFLAGDRRHELKFFGAYNIEFSKEHNVNVGASYRARSGAPTTPLGRHVLYGNGEVFLLPRGTGERMPWIHNVDLNVSYAFLKTQKQSLSVTCDVFNLLNLKGIIRRGTGYTTRPVLPIEGDQAKDPYVGGDRNRIDPNRILPADQDPEERARPFGEQDRQLTFGAPLEYQAPITLRVGLKSTF
ncbi:MAG: TonB-dependent receptor [Polyangiales bacterium]